MISLLKAVCTGPLPFTLDNWSTSSSHEFSDVTVHQGIFPGDVLKALIVSAQGWGGMAQLDTEANGHPLVRAMPGYVQLLTSLEPNQADACLISMLNGNDHSALSLVQHIAPYDFCLPSHPELPLIANAQPVPYDIVRKKLEPWMDKTIAALAMARVMLPKIRIIHVFPPPPVASNNLIMKGPEVFQAHLERFGITPLSLRVKWYFLANQIEFLDAPSQSIGNDLGLKDMYAMGATHGNEKYGQLIAQQLQANLNSLET
jgi:hypothetical protein